MADADRTEVLQVSCGSSHTVALLDCNIVASWGRGEDGQLGHGDAEQVNTPKAIHSLLGKDISSVCCGAEYTVAVSKKHQQVYSWGWGDFGRLGHGDCSDVFVPQQISFFNNMPIKQVACGDTHTLVCTTTGELYTFGRNQNGQLGHGNTGDLLAPRLVEDLKGRSVSSVAAGAEHSVVATSDGQVYAWGWGRYGNLGDGDRVDRHSPARVAALDDVVISHVACGWRHSAAVSGDGRVYTFGWSKYGQLGHGDHDDRLVPVEVSALTGRVIVQIAGGWRHTMALDQQGTAWGWGWNKDEAAPVVVDALAGRPVTLLACGWRHTVAVCNSGEVYSWGRGVNGQLGLGEEADEASPQLLKSLCRTTGSRAALLATATARAGYVAPSDRYGVVPDGDDCLAVPDMQQEPAPAMAVPDGGPPQQQLGGLVAAGSAGTNGTADASSDLPALKRARVAAPTSASTDDAAVPGS
eukprot:gene6154-6391_t